MRRIFLCFSAVLFFFVPTALAQNTELDAIVSAVDGLIIPGCNPEILFFESEPWLSVVVTQSGPIAPMLTGTQVDGMVFTAETKTRIAWDDLFIDADAAAERVAAIAEASVYQNAYGNYSGIRPVPRDSFALFGSQLTVYYPAERLSTFSGNSGAFSFYAFELDGLLADGACFPAGNAGDAATALSDACLRGSLPGFLADWPIGRRMEEARNILLLEDIPDLSTDFALYRFEAPQMRGATLLSTTDD
ncbi:MAG: hypothetical protein FWG37_06345, partial [Clostridia bacterium]|nr:hypothetical protein [Clostridia bacterium]